MGREMRKFWKLWSVSGWRTEAFGACALRAATACEVGEKQAANRGQMLQNTND
jgi:hypothetical protein